MLRWVPNRVLNPKSTIGEMKVGSAKCVVISHVGLISHPQTW